MVSRTDGRDGKRAIGVNGADEALIHENRCSGSAALDGQRGQARLGLRLRLRLEVEDKSGLLSLANADLLLGGILEAAFGDLYNVVLEFEIWEAQLAGSSKLPLKFSVEKDSCVVLTGNDKERAQVMTGLDGRVILGRNFGRDSGRNFSRGRVGRSARGRQRCFGRWLCRRGWWICGLGGCLWGSCLCRGGDIRSSGGRSRWLGLRYRRGVMFSREEKGRRDHDYRGEDYRSGGDDEQPCGVRTCSLFRPGWRRIDFGWRSGRLGGGRRRGLWRSGQD